MKAINKMSALILFFYWLPCLISVDASFSVKGRKVRAVGSSAQRNRFLKKKVESKKDKKMKKKKKISKNLLKSKFRKGQRMGDSSNSGDKIKIEKKHRSEDTFTYPDNLEERRYPVVQFFWALINNPEGCNNGCQLVDFFNRTSEATILHGTSAIPNSALNGEVTLVSSVYRTDALVDIQGNETQVDASYMMTAGQLGGAGLENIEGPLYVAIRVSDDPVSMDATELFNQLTSYATDGEWVQYAYWPHAISGPSEVRDWETNLVIDDTDVRLVRQGDVLQVVMKTFIELAGDHEKEDEEIRMSSEDFVLSTFEDEIFEDDVNTNFGDEFNKNFGDEFNKNFDDAMTDSPEAVSP